MKNKFNIGDIVVVTDINSKYAYIPRAIQGFFKYEKRIYYSFYDTSTAYSESILRKINKKPEYMNQL